MGILVKIPTKNHFQQITGKVEYMDTAVPHGAEKETHKKDLSIRYRLAGAYRHYNSTLEGKIR
jgi:hypothetical protein